MKKLMVTVGLAGLLAACSSPNVENSARIRGEVLSSGVSEVELRWLVDNPISRKGGDYQVNIDDQGMFEMDIPLERLAVGQLGIGSALYEVCLLPGDDVFIRVSDGSLDFSGKGAAKSRFLYEATQDGYSTRAFYSAMNEGKLNPTEFVEWAEDFKTRRLAYFDAFDEKSKLEKPFVAWFGVQTEVIFEELIREYPSTYAYRNDISLSELKLPASVDRYKRFSEIVDDDRVVYHGYASGLRNLLFEKMGELVRVDSTIDRSSAVYVLLADSLSGLTREYVLATWIISSLSNDHYDSVAVAMADTLVKNPLATRTLDLAFDKFNEKRSLLGQPLHEEFAQTVFVDTSGVEQTFGQLMDGFKGKVVYLDFWGMGCGPCRAAMPYARQLKDKLQEEPIEFVYASMDWVWDRNWGPLFEATQTRDNHFVLLNGFNSRLHRFMEINWVPCYMIFDKEGRLVDYNADRPSRMVEQGETSLERELRQLAMQ